MAPDAPGRGAAGAGPRRPAGAQPHRRDGVEPRRRRSLGLTLRGRGLLAAGLACASCAIALGEVDLLRAAVVLLAVPVLAALLMARARATLEVSRSLEAAVVTAGEPARLRLVLVNRGALPTGVVQLEDARPGADRPARDLLDRLWPGEPRELVQEVRIARRGRYQLGPLAVRLEDGLGVAERVRRFPGTTTLVVAPPVRALPAVWPSGGGTGEGGRSGGAAAAARVDDVTPREHRAGDELRRVHWRSTARRGELMVRREERAGALATTLLVDVRAAAHRDRADGVEDAVAVAASVGVHLLRGRGGLRVHAGGRELVVAADPVTGRRALLESLATLRPVAGGRLAVPVGAGPLVAVLGRLDDADVRALAAHPGGGHALLLGGRGEPGQRAAAATLLARGWRIAAVRDLATLPDAWATLLAGTAHGRPADAAPPPVLSGRPGGAA